MRRSKCNSTNKDKYRCSQQCRTEEGAEPPEPEPVPEEMIPVVILVSKNAVEKRQKKKKEPDKKEASKCDFSQGSCPALSNFEPSKKKVQIDVQIDEPPPQNSSENTLRSVGVCPSNCACPSCKEISDQTPKSKSVGTRCHPSCESFSNVAGSKSEPINAHVSKSEEKYVTCSEFSQKPSTNNRVESSQSEPDYSKVKKEEEPQNKRENNDAVPVTVMVPKSIADSCDIIVVPRKQKSESVGGCWPFKKKDKPQKSGEKPSKISVKDKGMKTPRCCQCLEEHCITRCNIKK